jgi:hypothetical protein
MPGNWPITGMASPTARRRWFCAAIQVQAERMLPFEARPSSDARPRRKAEAHTPKETGELYRSVVAQVALLVVRDLFDADAMSTLDSRPSLAGSC